MDLALTLARAAVAVFAVWVAIGAVFAIAFTASGAGRADPDARAGSVGFRVLIFPASVALWPLLAWRWILGRREAPRESNAHRDRAEEAQR